ncbi:thiamine pyrophosphate-requiring protein [Amycolatopsis aidingensis]|uniref:thiamine pyrophosphate-requiring protein n=1 Tax=Amycolatopsis aidingensis TaxID=2842453 RepID=UPI001E583327|nr:thiamine pyrophosphate-requiring protein [Amycolatopsis aidingensis]
MSAPRYTTSTAFLEALTEVGVRYVFANLGSDHPGLIEAYARARAEGTVDRFPELVICPHESVAFSAAQGYAQATGRIQAVLVHVECGTQNIGGMLHNAAKGRVPVLVFAGASPVTQHGEHTGSRDEFIQWVQDVHDQRGIVRGYTKYDYEIRVADNVKQIVHRAAQIAASEPAGPVYLVGAREVMEQRLEQAAADRPEYALDRYTPVEPAALAQGTLRRIGEALAGAARPVIVTSYLGRDQEAVPALVGLAERLGAPVIESVPMWLNFPADHPLHGGHQWNIPEHHPLLAAADVVLVLGSDVPWIPVRNGPGAGARVFVVDVDPLKEQMPLWHLPAELFARADLGIAARQLTGFLEEPGRLDAALVRERLAAAATARERRLRELTAREQPDPEVITPEYLLACLRAELATVDGETIVLTEAITNYLAVSEHLRRTRPGGLLGSGGGSLGWYAGAAIGVKLARPDALVVSVVGDGTYLFGVPASALWTARRYGVPSLTIILDNEGWQAPKVSALGVHPDGAAAEADDFGVGFAPGADLPAVAAAAGGALARTVTAPAELPAAVREAVQTVRSGRSAVLAARLPPVQP